MRSKFEKISLITIGAVLGITLSLNYPAIAEKNTKPQLPLDELRTFAEVYGKIKSDYVESQDGNLVFERKGNEGKYRATWEQTTDTLTLDTKVVNQGEFQYLPLLVQQGLEITHSQVTVRDAKNCDRALQLIAESQKEYQESR